MTRKRYCYIRMQEKARSPWSRNSRCRRLMGSCGASGSAPCRAATRSAAGTCSGCRGRCSHTSWSPSISHRLPSVGKPGSLIAANINGLSVHNLSLLFIANYKCIIVNIRFYCFEVWGLHQCRVPVVHGCMKVYKKHHTCATS